ncbi:SURF1 family protein [Tessaracoccus rhinocerotis]|uniref:SURF1-like protein n=1 Tax=Tessaracoccus rhinocerotis TaxID=1689449 RepID=A0A553JWY4_9ACTN|nr:SURF1 family protein [Tessaracoccus rhinocerotis]TRY16955.1 SURF1 family protein [Tessaracoccus rhinocerotis]
MGLRTKQAIAIVVGVVVAIGMLLLGLWQMSRFQLSMEDVAAERGAMPPVSLSENVAEDGTIADIYGRIVTLEGGFRPDHNLLVGTEWPMRSVVAFEMTDGRTVAVVVGTADRGATLPEELLEVSRLEGVFLGGDASGDGETVPSDAPEGSLPTLRLQSMVQTWPQPMIQGYVTVAESFSAEYGLGRADALLPEGQGTAMHQGYAMQWWVFAGAAIAFSIFVARGFAKDEEKKRARAERRLAAQAAATDVDAESASEFTGQ